VSMQRVRQLLAALQAKVSESDRAYVAAFLETELQDLFFAMSLGDQAHALRVAYTAEKLAFQQFMVESDVRLLCRCALLHDIGRGYEAGTPWAKTLAVLLQNYQPSRFKCNQQRDLEKVGYFQRIMYHHRHHPELGARLLRERGFEAEADIIARHHQPKKPGDELVLNILRKADKMN